MDLDLDAADEAFRTEARDWLAAHVPAVPLPSLETADGFAAHREWEATLAADRWSVVSWPEEFGGRGGSLLRWLVFEEEYYGAGAPGRVSQNGINLLAPTLFEHGTAEQLARILPATARGEVIWAIRMLSGPLSIRAAPANMDAPLGFSLSGAPCLG
ncbi:acyl-CoA dehydrogenase family protein, partial [Streptomyces sp. NPDC088184]|uniref:acyl-CoA dehydrogenase family protein n=1 Tax=Streptomyces sp. NPDC088184 TaxID=3160991 RepID=UPI003446E3AB